jgi:hypothetical protein
VAWGLQGARPWGLPNLKGVRRSRLSHLVDRPVHPLHLHTLRGTPHMASSSCRRRRRRNSLALSRGLWQMSISTIKLSTHWVLAQTYTICWGTLDGCNSPTGYQQTPTRSLTWKSWWPWRPFLMRGCQVYHSVSREFNKWFHTSKLWSYLGSKRELRRKLTCQMACWMGFGI